jgi:Tripartite tricarboxylate transporter family receptor
MQNARGLSYSSHAVVAGDVQMTFENPTVSLPLVQGGKVRALAVTSEKRNAQAPYHDRKRLRRFPVGVVHRRGRAGRNAGLPGNESAGAR